MKTQHLYQLHHVLFLVLIACVVNYSTAACAGLSTNDILKHYNDVRSATTWGASTNGIEFGIRVSATGVTKDSQFKTFSYIYNTTSSNLCGLWKPPHGSRLDIRLQEKTGKVVARTKAGNTLCHQPVLISDSGRVIILPAKIPVSFDENFDVRSCFKLEKSGDYVLFVKAHLYVLSTNSSLTAIDLPEASVTITFTDSDLQR